MRLQILKTGIAVAVLRLGGAGLGILVTIVLSRMIGPEGLGYYAYAITLVTLAGIPVNNGWGTLLMRTTSRGGGSGSWAETRTMAQVAWQGAALVAGIFFLVSLAVTQDFLASESLPYTVEVLALLAVVLFFDQLSANRVALIRGFHKPQLAQVTDLIARPGFLLAGIGVLVLLSSGTLTLLNVFRVLAFASIANFLLGRLMLAFITPGSFGATEAARFDLGWVKAAGYLAGTAGLVVLNSYLDILILGFFADAKEIGFYRVAAQIGVLAGLGYTALNFIAAPRFAALDASDDRQKLTAEATFFARLAFAATLPVPVILWFAGEWLITAVFGSQFVVALPAMIVLSVLQVISAACGMARTMLVMSGMERQVLKTTIASLVLSIALNVILIPWLGIIGAALANLTATSMWNIALWLIVLRKLGTDTSILGLNGRPSSGF